MPDISLVPYTVTVKSKNGGNYVDVGATGPIALTHLFRDYLVLRSAHKAQDPDRKQVLSVAHRFEDGNVTAGFCEKGSYGWKSRLANVEGEGPEMQRTPDHAEMIPYYFMLYVPNEGEQATLILQKFGNDGMREILGNDFLAHFQMMRDQYQLHINPLADARVLQEFLDHGDVKKIKYLKRVRYSDLADNLQGELASEMGYLEVKITAKRGGWLPFKDTVAGHAAGTASLVELLPTEDFDPEQYKVVIARNGKPRTFTLGRPGVQPRQDITNLVQLVDGQPTFASVHALAQEWLTTLLTGE